MINYGRAAIGQLAAALLLSSNGTIDPTQEPHDDLRRVREEEWKASMEEYRKDKANAEQRKKDRDAPTISAAEAKRLRKQEHRLKHRV